MIKEQVRTEGLSWMVQIWTLLKRTFPPTNSLLTNPLTHCFVIFHSLAGVTRGRQVGSTWQRCTIHGSCSKVFSESWGGAQGTTQDYLPAWSPASSPGYVALCSSCAFHQV